MHTINNKSAATIVFFIVISICTVIITGCKDKPSPDLITNSTPYSITSDQLLNLFDELDSKVNEGKGYSEYQNTDGFPTGALLAWSESYLMQAYADMYLATSDTRYLDKMQYHISSILSNRDDIAGIIDYRSELVPCWGTDKYTANRERLHFASHTGMITFPMLEFVQLAENTGNEKYKTAAKDVLFRTQESINYHEKDWRIDHYVYPYEFYKKENYILPISQQAAMGRSLLLLYKITGNEDYLFKSESLAGFINDNALVIDNKGYYLLKQGFSSGETLPRDQVSDISHATITIHFIYLSYKNGIVFDREDVSGFARTIKHLSEVNDNHFPRFLDGSGNFDSEITAGQYAFLTEFENGIYDSIIDLYFNHLRIDQTAKYMQEDWWGTVMLGLSRLILYKY